MDGDRDGQWPSLPACLPLMDGLCCYVIDGCSVALCVCVCVCVCVYLTYHICDRSISLSLSLPPWVVPVATAVSAVSIFATNLGLLRVGCDVV